MMDLRIYLLFLKEEYRQLFSQITRTPIFNRASVESLRPI